MNVQDAIVRALHDEDLSVVRAALSIDGLARIASPPCLLKAYDHVLSRCTSIFNKSEYILLWITVFHARNCILYSISDYESFLDFFLKFF